MGHGPEHHLEHAEHASHAAHDDFDKRVTISIAMVAAVLAAVTLLGHLAHNMTLGYKNDAAIQHNKAVDKWMEYQAYNIRSHMYQAFSELGESTSPRAGSEDAFAKAKGRWQAQVKKYESVTMPTARKAAEEYTKAGEALLEKSEHIHHQSIWLGVGELILQLAIVISSLSILTKLRFFWFTGLTCAAIGVGVAAVSAVIPQHSHEHGSTEHVAPDTKKSEHHSPPEPKGR